jgi:NitT/TauT family transport system substrate-binding protein
MRRSTFLAGSAALVAPSLIGSPGYAADFPLRVGSTTADDGTPMLYAQKSGLFKKHQLDVTIQTLASGGAGAPAVIGGALDTSRTSLMALVTAHSKGIPLKIIAPGGLYESSKLFAAMVVNKDSPIKTIADLSGKTIGTFALRDLNSLAAMSWIDKNGGNSSTVKFVEISVNASVAAIQNGKLDAATLLAPTLDAAVKANDVRVIGPVWNGIANKFLISAWYATEDYIAKNSDTIKRYTAALREAAQYCIAHPDETLPLIAEYEQLNAGDLRGTVRSSWQTTLDVAQIQPVIDLAAKYKYIDAAYPARDLVSPIAFER